MTAPNTNHTQPLSPAHQAPYSLRSKSRAAQKTTPYTLRSTTRAERAAKAQAIKLKSAPRSRETVRVHVAKTIAPPPHNPLLRDATPSPEPAGTPANVPATPQHQTGADNSAVAPDAPRKPQRGAASSSALVATSTWSFAGALDPFVSERAAGASAACLDRSWDFCGVFGGAEADGWR